MAEERRSERSFPLRLILVSFLTGFSGAVMPGPLLVAVIGQTSEQGFRAVIGLVTGHALLELAIVGLLATGMRAVLARSRVRGGIGIVGGAALAWMACDMLGGVGGLSLNLSGAGGEAALSWPKLLLWGAAVCAANPYFTGWWATIGAGQIAYMAPRTVGEYFCFYVGHEASDYAWYSLVGLILITGRNWMSDSVYRGIIFVCAVLIGFLGLWFFWRGWRFVLARNAPSDASVDPVR